MLKINIKRKIMSLSTLKILKKVLDYCNQFVCACSYFYFDWGRIDVLHVLEMRKSLFKVEVLENAISMQKGQKSL